MQLKRLFQQIYTRFFSESEYFLAPFFNLLAFAGIAAGITVSIVSAITGIGAVSVVSNLVLGLFGVAMLFLADKARRYRLCSWLVVIAIFIISFPTLFFLSGGYKSGISSFFMLAFIFTAILLEKLDKIIALSIEFIIYITCCLVAYFYPQTVTPFLEEKDYMTDVIISTVACGVILLLVVSLRSRMFFIKQVQMQEQSRELEARNETLTRYDRMKSDFLATVAHEVNTPLAVIAASSSDTLDLLKETPLRIDEISENQTIIERRVKLIDSILLDLMDTVSIENGRLPLNRQPLSMVELIRSVCETHCKSLNINNNRIVYEPTADLPKIWADMSRIEQVMINLISNAEQHTKNGMITISLTQSENQQVVSVADNGEGMDEDVARVVLKQYVSTKADYWRHGIGLSVCRRIIMAHGGEIWVDSEKGRGTTVAFALKEGYGE